MAVNLKYLQIMSIAMCILHGTYQIMKIYDVTFLSRGIGSL